MEEYLFKLGGKRAIGTAETSCLRRPRGIHEVEKVSHGPLTMSFVGHMEQERVKK